MDISGLERQPSRFQRDGDDMRKTITVSPGTLTGSQLETLEFILGSKGKHSEVSIPIDDPAKGGFVGSCIMIPYWLRSERCLVVTFTKARRKQIANAFCGYQPGSQINQDRQSVFKSWLVKNNFFPSEWTNIDILSYLPCTREIDAEDASSSEIYHSGDVFVAFMSKGLARDKNGSSEWVDSIPTKHFDTIVLIEEETPQFHVSQHFKSTMSHHFRDTNVTILYLASKLIE